MTHRLPKPIRILTLLVPTLLLAAFPAAAQSTDEATDPILMSPSWAEQACEAWNLSEPLTGGLTKWIKNDKDRGYKIIQLYRTDCGESPWAELKLVAGDEGGAECVYGGEAQTAELISGADYIMHAKTERWQQMGAGNYGPMKAMMTGRLKFKGPMFEAMGNMGPFASFLLLVGEVPSDASACWSGADDPIPEASEPDDDTVSPG